MIREDALDSIYENVENENLVKHMLATEAIMEALAQRLGEDKQEWGLAGLLHDIDVELTEGDMNSHGRLGADLIRESEHCELVMEPELSVVVFRRLGWDDADYHAWSERLLHERFAFVVPTTWHGETVLRYCVVNPLTTVDDIAAIIDSLDAPNGAPAAR